MARFLLGIDAGTSVIKSTIFDLDGREVAGAGRNVALLHPDDERSVRVEQEMGAVWEGVQATVRESVAKAGCLPQEVAAVGVTAQGDGTWLVDAQGAPVRPAITWLDGRTGPLVRAAHESGLSRAVFAITGTALNTALQSLHLRWLAEHEAQSLARAAAALRAKDWIYLNLTGVVSTDESDASHTYFAAATRAYDPRVLDLLGIGELARLLPPARAAAENVAPLLPDVAAVLGLRPGTPVAAGPFDVAASDLGSGVLRPGDACTILGTAGIHQIVLEAGDAPIVPPENVGYTMCHAPAGRLVRLLPTMTGTLNLEWFIRELWAAEFTAATAAGRDPWAELEELAQTVPFGSDGVLYHPYIDPAGERSPFVRPDARAQFTGITLRHTRATLLRAVYEGVILSALDCYRTLGRPVRSLKLAGGGARSPFWAQMFADALGCPVVTLEGSEAGARGAAINAGVAVGIYADYDAAVARTVRPAREFTPAPGQEARWLELLDRYRCTYRAMFPVWSRRMNEN